MAEEISLSKIGEYAPFFSDPQLDMVLSSIAQGNNRARFWRSISPKGCIVYLLWDQGNNVFYLNGTRITKEVTIDLASLINTRIRKQAIEEHLACFKIRPLSPSMMESMPVMFYKTQLHRTSSLFYAFQGETLPEMPVSGLENLEYIKIDKNFLEKSNFKNIQYVRAEVDWMWPSRDRFHEDGFGYAAVLMENIVCWCTAEYFSDTKCGIGIETIQMYQNKGIATETTARFVDFCLHENITPHWECDTRNTASIRVAEKVGFKRLQEKSSYLVLFMAIVF